MLLSVLVVVCTIGAAMTGSAAVLHRAARPADPLIAAAPASASSARQPCDGAGRLAAKACSLMLLGFGPPPAAFAAPRGDGAPAHLAGVRAASLTPAWRGSPPFRPPRPAA